LCFISGFFGQQFIKKRNQQLGPTPQSEIFRISVALRSKVSEKEKGKSDLPTAKMSISSLVHVKSQLLKQQRHVKAALMSVMVVKFFSSLMMVRGI